MAHRRGEYYVHLEACLCYTCHSIAKALSASTHGVFDDFMPSVQLADENNAGWKDSNPKNVRLPEYKTDYAQQQQNRRSHPWR